MDTLYYSTPSLTGHIPCSTVCSTKRAWNNASGARAQPQNNAVRLNPTASRTMSVNTENDLQSVLQSIENLQSVENDLQSTESDLQSSENDLQSTEYEQVSAENDLQVISNSTQSIPTITITNIDLMDHAEQHRLLHEMHHQQALANQSTNGEQHQEQSINRAQDKDQSKINSEDQEQLSDDVQAPDQSIEEQQNTINDGGDVADECRDWRDMILEMYGAEIGLIVEKYSTSVQTPVDDEESDGEIEPLDIYSLQ